MKNTVISFLNTLILLGFLLWIPNLNYLNTTINGFLIIAFPWLLYYILYKIKGKQYYKFLTILNILVFTFSALMFYAFYQNSKARVNMYFDKYNVHPLQFKAEESIKNYVAENAKYPDSYEPIQFENLDSMKVSKLNNLELNYEETISGATTNGKVLLDSVKTNSEFTGYGNYFFRHSYNLKNVDGKLLNRVAFIELDRDLKIKSLFNEEDFTRISWMDHFGKEKD